MNKLASQIKPGDVLWRPEKVAGAGKLYPPSQATVKAVGLHDHLVAVVNTADEIVWYEADEEVQTVEPFCEHHMKTKENTTGTDCTAHLDSGRVFPCPYRSPEHAQRGRMLDDQRVCPDYGPLATAP